MRMTVSSVLNTGAALKTLTCPVHFPYCPPSLLSEIISYAMDRVEIRFALTLWTNITIKKQDSGAIPIALRSGYRFTDIS